MMESGNAEAELWAKAPRMAEAEKQERLSGESYLRAVADYVKWTTTLAGAAVLWVGNDVLGLGGYSHLVGAVGLLFLLASLIVALVAAYRVLQAWEGEWLWRGKWLASCLLHDLDGIMELGLPDYALTALEEVSHQVRGEAIDMMVAAKGPSKNATRFRRWVICHVSLLVLGLCTYAVARLLAG